MPAISKIRYTNVIYENGAKRYIDNVFQFEGYNGILLLENGGGKTVFVQTLIQAILPHKTVANRKIQETLLLNNNIAHIAVEWILEEAPRRYALTAVSLFIDNKEQLASYKFVNEYGPNDKDSIEHLPFVKKNAAYTRPASREEIAEYYRSMESNRLVAKFFSDQGTLKDYGKYIEDAFKIIPSEWHKIATINATEGGVEEYFNKCNTTGELVDQLLIPTVEEAIAGDGSQDFVELFQKQRTHFQKQMQLSERIEELQSVSGELGKYNESLKAYYELEQALTEEKAKLKAMHQYIQKSLLAKTESLAEQRETLAKIQTAQNENKRQEAGLAVAVAEQKMRSAEKEFFAIQRVVAEKQANLLKLQTEENNLEYAWLRQELSEEQERIQVAQIELNRLDNDEEIEDLQEQLAENSAELKGYFVDANHKLELSEQQYQRQIAEVQEEQATQREARQQQEAIRRQLDKKQGQYEASISACVTRMGDIEHEVLEDNINHKVVDEYPKWQEQNHRLREDIENYNKNICSYTEEKNGYKTSIPAKHEELQQLKSDAQSNEMELKRIDEESHILIIGLQAISQLALMVMDTRSLYQRHQSITNQLEENIEKLMRVQAEMLYKERIAHRYLDEYASQENFTADAHLTDKINQYCADFTMLLSGTEYFQQACRRQAAFSAEELYTLYPLWSATIITTVAEVSKVVEKFQSVQAELSQPLVVLSEQEARNIVAGNPYQVGAMLVPLHWQNVMPMQFKEWLESLQAKAVLVTEEKGKVEKRLRLEQELLQRLKTFYHQHPYEVYQECKSAELELASKIELSTMQLHSLITGEEQVDIALTNCQQKVSYAEKEQLRTLQKIKLAQAYIVHQEEHQQYLKKQTEISQEKVKLDHELKVKDKAIELAASMLIELKSEQNSILNHQKELQLKPFYHEVQEAEIKQSVCSYEMLAQNRRMLLDALEGKQASRGKVQAEFTNAKENQQKLQQRIANFCEKAETKLDEAFIFPIDGKIRLRHLAKELKSLKQELQTSLEIEKQKMQTHQQAIGAHENELRAYDKLYRERIIFTEELTTVAQSLQIEKQRLQSLEHEIQLTLKSLQSEEKELQDIQMKLKLENPLLQFTHESIPSIVLEIAIEQKSIAKLKTLTMQQLSVATKQLETVTAMKITHDASKEKLIRYCESKIANERLRRSIVDGIRYKVLYEEFLKWYVATTNNISSSIRYAENERQEHFEYVEQIITHIYLYLGKVRDELKEIPKKTRIKIGDTAKEIYVIALPEWKEQEGREKIRQYFEHITRKLDSAEYRDENGKEKSTEVKNKLAVMLKTQQLLNRLIGENAITVKCRKASSDKYISSSTFSWEESNKWSGGEKWSKNMALFLGCLNYLSEKRKHIRKTAYCNRVVIADNPFGKASSDHVLDPIFFIAKQLGFQFIALTAHDEGSFIRKYFPVVYSCRFSSSYDQKTKIIQADKEVQTAFFQEKNPDSLNRLTDYQEIGMF